MEMIKKRVKSIPESSVGCLGSWRIPAESDVMWKCIEDTELEHNMYLYKRPTYCSGDHVSSSHIDTFNIVDVFL